MKLIIILGTQESSKDALVSLVLKGAPDHRLKLKYLHFQDIMEKWSWMGKEKQAAFRKELNTKLEQLLAETLKKGGETMLVSGYITVPTPTGYVPLLSAGLFEAFTPDMIVLIEDKTKFSIKGSAEKKRQLAEQQRLNRIYATFYSASSGAPLHLIQVDPRHLRDTYNDLFELIKEVV